MSVVNKMLQDLEARKAEPEKISADYQAPPKNNIIIWAGLFVSLLLTIAVYWWLMGPKWTQDSQPSTNVVNVKANPKEVELHFTPDEIDIKMDVDISDAQTSQIAVNLPQKKNTKKSADITTSSPYETKEVNSAIAATPITVTPIVTEQSSSQADTIQTMLQSPVVSKNIAEDNTDKTPLKNQSSFSISDSSEKNKLAGAKQSVISALSLGDKDLAIQRLEELLRVQPSNIEARKKLAALLFAQKRSNQAEHVLQQGINTHPQRSDLRLMMARLYMQRKDNEAAIKLLNGVQPDAANQREFLAYRAALLQQYAHYELAKHDYVQLLETDHGNAKWWLGLAITQDRLGQTNEALSAYRTAYNKEQLSPSVVKFVEHRMIQIEGAR